MYRSIRFRLTLWYSTIVAVTFALVAIATYQYVSRTLMASVDQAVINEVKWVTARLERQSERGEPEAILKEEFREHSAYFPLKEYVEIWDSSGAIYYQSLNLVGDTLALHV